MKKNNYVYKNSSKNDFAVDLLIVVISALLTFMAAKFFENRVAIVFYAISIAVCYCRIAIDAIEKVLAKKFDADIISTAAILLVFASQKFLVASIISIIYSLSKCLMNFINSCFSEKLLENEKFGPLYTVIDGENEKKVLSDDLIEGDRVAVKKGDYLAFSYIYEAENSNTKKVKAGVFNLCDEAIVTVIEPQPYEVDFEASAEKIGFSSTEKKIKLAVLIYTIAAIVTAVAMFALKTYSDSFSAGLYALGIYLLFACPASLDSGIIVSGFFAARNLKENGINIEKIDDLEKISKVKKIYFTDGVTVSNDEISADVIKALKVAEVLKVDTALIGKENDKVAKIAKVCGLKNYEVIDFENAEEFFAKESAKNVVALVCESPLEETKNLLCMSVDANNEKTVCKSKLSEFVKATKHTKIFKWFITARAAIGALINFVAIAVFASGKLDLFLSNRVLKSESIEEQGNGIINGILKVMLYEDTLAPWLIAVMHLVMINVFLLVALAFLNNNKKVR